MARHADTAGTELSNAQSAGSDNDAGEVMTLADPHPDSLERANGLSDDQDFVEDRSEAATNVGRWMSPTRLTIISCLIVAIALAGLVGWWGYRAYQTRQTERDNATFLKVGRQAALYLTTIDFKEADADVSRILNSATGAFLDDFQKRSQPFIDVVKQARSKSVGTIAAAGLESVTGDQAQVLVAVQVKTSIGGTPDQQPRGWRMRVDVQKVGDDVKVANVQFVP
jgi:Mce-associated membrane protein